MPPLFLDTTMKKNATTVFCALACASQLTLAAPPHEHGVANLNITLDDQGVLAIELYSPLDNLVGFEHAPQNNLQQEALADAYAQLKAGATLFAPPVSANCSLQQAQIKMPYYDGDSAAHEDEKAHGEHDSHKAADGHEHGDAHDHGHEHAHSDAHAEYRFQCTQPAALKTLNIGLFDAFPRTLRIRVQSAMPQQGSHSLRKGEHNSITF